MGYLIEGERSTWTLSTNRMGSEGAALQKDKEGGEEEGGGRRRRRWGSA